MSADVDARFSQEAIKVASALFLHAFSMIVQCTLKAG
jgi:hypothetical protein